MPSVFAEGILFFRLNRYFLHMDPKFLSYWKRYVFHSLYTEGTALRMVLVDYRSIVAFVISTSVLLVTIIAYVSTPYLKDLV